MYHRNEYFNLRLYIKLKLIGRTPSTVYCILNTILILIYYYGQRDKDIFFIY